MLIHGALILLIIVVLNSLAYCYAFLEERIVAKTQQRIGPNRTGARGNKQILVNYLKSLSKSESFRFITHKIIFSTAFVITIILPYAFGILIFYPLLSVQKQFGGLLFLFLILLAAMAINNLFLFAYSETNLRIKMRRQELISLLGAIMFMLSTVPPLLHAGSWSLIDINMAQQHFPYAYIFFSPFLFLSAIIAFISIFFIIPSPPMATVGAEVFSGVWHSLFALSRNVWVIGLFALWVAIFLGGGIEVNLEILEILKFIFKLSMIVVFFLWLRRSFPAMRVSDSMEFGFKMLLPASCAAVVGEIIWIAVFRA